MVQKRVLIIEDELAIQELYQRVFEKYGWQTVGAQTGKEAFTKGKGQNFDLILIDIMLPEKNGVGVLKDIKADSSWKNIPVFMLTNLGQETIIRQAFQLGADGYLLKAQLLPEQIVEEVENFLANNSKTAKQPTSTKQQT